MALICFSIIVLTQISPKKTTKTKGHRHYIACRAFFSCSSDFGAFLLKWNILLKSNVPLSTLESGDADPGRISHITSRVKVESSNSTHHI